MPTRPGFHHMTVQDRLRQRTDPHVQERIDESIVAGAHAASHMTRDEISARLEELDNEWDIERVLEAQSALTALLGLYLGVNYRRPWLLLTAVTSGFLLQHALQRWCPPLELHRRLGVRSRREIERERAALKALRGDFANVPATGSDLERAEAALDGALR